MKLSLNDLGIFGKLFIAFLLAAVIPVGVTWYFAHSVTGKTAKELAESGLLKELGSIANSTDGWLRVNHQTLVEHAETTAMVSMKPELQKSVLVAMHKHQPWTVVTWTFGPNGQQITRSDDKPLVSVADRKFFRDAMAGKPVVQEVVINRTSFKPAWVIAVPLRGPAGEVIGITGKASNLDEITAELAKRQIGQTGKAILLSPEGKLIGMTGLKQEKELQDYSNHPVFTTAPGSARIIRYQDGGRPVLAAVQTTRLDWRIAVQMDEEEAMAPVRRTDMTMLLLLAAAIGIAALFALSVAPTMAKPIRRLTSIAEEISRGKFEHDLPETARGDEIGALARAIERTTKSLRLAMARLTERK